jgi:hypothetical protein
MIVKRIWSTKKYLHEGSSPRIYVGSIKKHWVGYFLFGFIPLYIKQLQYVRKGP